MAIIAENICSMTADEIRACLTSDSNINKEYAKAGRVSYKLCDAASLFVMTAYLFELPVEKSEKDKLRKSAYMAFLNNRKNEYPKVWSMMELLIKDKSSDIDLNVKVLKGGSYKIKNYYLENYKLCDIRGASVLLTHVEEDIIPKMISDKFIPECIVYSGGGNIFAVVPESCDDRFSLELEKAAKRLLISADIAYYISDTLNLSDIFGIGYKHRMLDVENKLNERKKLILNCTVNASSDFIGSSINVVSDKPEDCFEAHINGKTADKQLICSACGKRNADYLNTSYLTDDGNLCASCLHKRAVGSAAKRSRYINRFNLYNTRPAERVSSLSDISKDYIAVIYGDGNNMGGIIQQFDKITQMMEFSRDVKNIIDRAVFGSMNEHEMTRFEVVGLGGDDVFIIVEGSKAIKFTVSLIKKYNSAFDKYRELGQVSTMSAGIAIAKTNIPIQIIIDKAEEKLSDAKSIAKLKKDNCGSLSFEIMDTFDGGDSDSGKTSYGVEKTMLPYYTDTAEDIIAMADGFKSNKNKTRLRNVLDAFMNAESAEEANLFLKYFNAKDTGYSVVLSEAAGYSIDGGFYKDSDGKRYFAWNDILNMLDYIE